MATSTLPIPATILAQQQQQQPSSVSVSNIQNQPIFMSATASETNPSTKNAIPAGPDLNAKAADVYQELQSGIGRVAIGNDPDVLAKINDFLTTYPKRKNKGSGSGYEYSTWIDMSVRDLFRQTIQTAIDIINDISKLVSDKQFMSSTELRRGIFDVFVQKKRRLYVGLWLIFLSFLLYFIDADT